MSPSLCILPNLLACATCMPDAGSRVSQAQGNAILFMLVLLACVLATIVYTMFSFARRQRRVLSSQATDGLGDVGHL